MLNPFGGAVNPGYYYYGAFLKPLEAVTAFGYYDNCCPGAWKVVGAGA